MLQPLLQAHISRVLLCAVCRADGIVGRSEQRVDGLDLQSLSSALLVLLGCWRELPCHAATSCIIVSATSDHRLVLPVVHSAAGHYLPGTHAAEHSCMSADMPEAIVPEATAAPYVCRSLGEIPSPTSQS